MAAGDISHAEVVGTLLTGALATLYTVPANRVVIAYDLHLLNVDSATTYYPEVQVVPAGGSDGDRYKRVLPQAAAGGGLLAGQPLRDSGNPMWAAGTLIRAREAGGTANKIAFSLGVTLKEV